MLLLLQVHGVVGYRVADPDEAGIPKLPTAERAMSPNRGADESDDTDATLGL
jgi:hypothetical protein